MAFLVAQMVKNLSAMRKTWVWSLGWEDPVEEGMVTHSVFLPGESPWTEEPGRLQSMGSQRVGHDWATKQSTTTVLYIQESSCELGVLCNRTEKFFRFKKLGIQTIAQITKHSARGERSIDKKIKGSSLWFAPKPISVTMVAKGELVNFQQES